MIISVKICDQVASLSVRRYGVVIVIIKWNFISRDSGKDIFIITVTYFWTWKGPRALRYDMDVGCCCCYPFRKMPKA